MTGLRARSSRCTWLAVISLAAVLCACGRASDDGDEPAVARNWDLRAEAARVPRSPTGPISADCVAMRGKLNWYYDSVRRCERDSDCVYVEGLYAAVPRESPRRALEISDCRSATPYLIVANGARLSSVISELLWTATIQGKVCAEPQDQDARDYPCNWKGSFIPSGAPSCRQGRCQAAPASATI